MFLSSRDIKWAIECGKLKVEPRPDGIVCGYDETSIDLHLASPKLARVWNIDDLKKGDEERGVAGDDPPEVHIGRFDWKAFAARHQMPVPESDRDTASSKKLLVYSRQNEIVVRRFGFVLWPTAEEVGTPTVDPNKPLEVHRHPELICFVNAKSTLARTGLLVHFTAPTIHANWAGNITLEIANLGPFTLVLKEGDALAQLTVATISSAPDLTLKRSPSKTQGQTDPSGAASARK